MDTPSYTHVLTQVVDKLSDNNSFDGLLHQHKNSVPLFSGKSLYRIIELLRAIQFLGEFQNSQFAYSYHLLPSLG